MHAMSGDVEGPESVVAEAFRALDAERWEEFVSWVDPEAVEEFRAGQLRWWKEAGERRPLTADDIRRHKPDMPPQVADHHLQQWRSSDAARPSIDAYFADVASVEELEGMGGEEMLARRLARLSPRAKLEAELANLTDDAGLAEVDPRELLPRRQVIGAVREGDSTAHVVYRLGFADELPGPTFLATARRTPKGWRLLLDDGFFGLENWQVLP